MLVKINIYQLKFWHSDKQVIYIHLYNFEMKISDRSLWIVALFVYHFGSYSSHSHLHMHIHVPRMLFILHPLSKNTA